MSLPAPASTLPSAATPVAPSLVVAERDVDRQVARSVGWQAAKIGLQVAQYVVLARLVLPAEYGKFALALPVYALLTALNDGGLSTAAVTNRQYDSRLATDLALTQLGLGVVMAAAMALLAPLLATIYGVPDLRVIGWCLAGALLANAVGLQSRARLRRNLSIGALAMVDIAGVIAGLAAALLVARGAFGGVTILVVAQLTTVTISSVVAVTLAPVPLGRFRGGAPYRHALQVGGHMVASDVLNSVRNQFPALAIGFFVVLSDVGLFNRANQLLGLPLLVLAPAITNYLLPMLSRTRGDPAQFRRHVQRTLRLFLAATIPVCVWVAFGPADLLATVLGEAWRPVMPILGSLSPMFIVQIVAVVSLVTLVSAEYSRTARRFAFWNLGLTVIAVLATAPFGVMAMAIGLTVSGLLLRAPLAVRYAIREGTMAAADVAAAGRFFVVVAGATAVALALTQLLPVASPGRELAGLVCALLITGAALRHVTRPGATQATS
jgi:O-antigen/teichoic acid export membrane protein